MSTPKPINYHMLALGIAISIVSTLAAYGIGRIIYAFSGAS